MFSLAVLLVVGTAAEQLLDKPYYDLDDARNLFKNFIQEHGKIYDPEEYLHRLEVFKENLKEINERNAVHPQTVYGVNHFADLTPEERLARYGSDTGSDCDKNATELHYPPDRITAPEQFDWRDTNTNTNTNNLFSAIESQYAIKHNKTLAFSEQQTLDCLVQSNGGWPNCGGGCPQYVMAYHEKFGVVPEDGYNPYIANQSTCHEDPTKVVTKVTGYNVYRPDEETLKQLVYENGPVAVGLDARDLAFHKKGIIYPHECTNQVGHAVLLVGYGVENDTKYWILKNSFGTNMGENGYHKLVRGINACEMGTSHTITCTVE